jgi:hypothetical protein
MEERRRAIPPITDFYKKDPTERMNILWTAAVDTWNKLSEIESMTREHNRILLFGDPPHELPLTETVRNLLKFQDKFEYWAKFIGGALILNFLGFAAGLIVAVVRFLPVLERIANQLP